MLVPVHPVRSAAAIALVAALAAAGCSTKQTSPAQLCDNGGLDLIAFASDRNHHGQFDVYLYDINGVGYRLLRNLNSSVASDSSPALSPDVLIVAFVTTRGATGSDILLYDRGSCGFIDDAAVNSAGNESEPAFSGDISRLAFVRDTLGHRRIRLVDATTSTLKLVPLPGLDADSTFDDWSPAPDRTGDNLVFVSDREGSPHLYLYRRLSVPHVDPLIALRSTGAVDVDPSITPDGRYLAFASNRPGGLGGYDIKIYDFTLGHFLLLQYLNSAGDEEHPSINASGTVLAYQTRRAAGAPWSVGYYNINTNAPTAPTVIARIDTTASDIQPSLVFP